MLNSEIGGRTSKIFRQYSLISFAFEPVAYTAQRKSYLHSVGCGGRVNKKTK